MLARQYRFHGLGSLNYAYRQGKTVRGQSLALRYVPNSRRHRYRVAVVVSRKVHKSAVVRNRIRRRIYEVVRTDLPVTTPPHDLVITVFSDTLATVPAAELHQLVVGLLKKAGLLA